MDAKGQVIGYVYKNDQVHYYSLPQTGEKQNDLAAILGASAIAISMIGLVGVKKRRNN
ncbi:LPXTG cell wall anchor domain-containing protein [Lactobacillus helveticus]|uniref:LPXTG cell wall anchor domain-containing protein n=1 Tax=Lactobacillus helveticus TaxID=1587 RepID=UPI001C6516C4|nr:LPXTG cell wall anchor domain-containing protein [Lactobacillus helveticus]